MNRILHDIRLSSRLVAKKPALATLAVLSLALGIGANTTIFSIIHSILLRPLPVRDPDRLVALYTSGGSGNLYGSSSFADFLDFQAESGVFSEATAFVWAPLTLARDGQGAERIWSLAVTPNYFRVLGIEAALGRVFTAAKPDARVEPEVVLSHGFWQRELGGDPTVLGQPIKLNGHLFTIVGIAPEEFRGTETERFPELWAPAGAGVELSFGAFHPEGRQMRALAVLGRLAEGIGIERARARLAVVADRLAAEHRETNEGRKVSLVPASRAQVHPFVRESVTGFLGLLMSLVGLLLLVACSNLASLMLVRGLGRQPEVAIRMAIGATRGSLVSLFLTETVLLSCIGGALGFFLAVWATHLLRALDPPAPFPLMQNLVVEPPVFFFTLALALAVGIFFGLAPAYRATRPNLASELTEKASVGAGRRSRLLGASVIVQIAFSVVLLITAGLFVRSLQKIKSVDLGFNSENVLVASFQLGPMSGYTPEEGRSLYQRLLERVETIPGVRSATLTSFVPMDFGGLRGEVFADGASRDSRRLECDIDVVGPDFFRTLGISIAVGRPFGPQDRENSQPVVVINQALAYQLWGNIPDIVGRRIALFEESGPMFEVIGVTRTGKYRSPREEATPFLYVPMSQLAEPMMSLVMRTEGRPRSLIGPVREAVREIDPELPAFNVRTLEEQVTSALFAERVAALLASALATLAIIQAAIGIYGVLAFSVGQRTREIGLRMAIGASPRAILSLIMGDALRLTTLGVVSGVFIAWMVTRLLRVFLYDVSAADPATYLGILFTVILCALLASYIPVRRASQVNPIISLRQG